MTKTLTTATFKDTVLGAEKPVLVDFWATWCPPCKAQLPIVDRLAEEFGEAAIVAKVDVDAEPELAQLFQIRSIPTLMVFKGGKLVQRFQGLTQRETLANALNGAL